MKVFLNKINESWVVDRFRDEWFESNQDISTTNLKDADIIWIFTPWLWNNISKRQLKSKKVLCSVYHIDFQKFTNSEKKDFYKRDKFVDMYHVISEKTKQQLSQLTDKKIISIPFWINQQIWFEIEDKITLRKKHNFVEEKYYIGSFQRDTEGHDLKSPKLIKGPDRFIEIVENLFNINKNIEVILTGKRRQYVISELNKRKIPFKYYEMASFQEINELYNLLNLYIVSSRIEGGPQAVVECGITKTPIISTDVGIASEILSSNSIFNMQNYKEATPDIDYAFKTSSALVTPQGFIKFRELLKEVYEN